MIFKFNIFTVFTEYDKIVNADTEEKAKEDILKYADMSNNVTKIIYNDNIIYDFFSEKIEYKETINENNKI